MLDAIYRAEVVDNADPEEEARVSVRVRPQMDGIRDADLPWAMPAFPAYWTLIPAVGRFVWVFFECGDPLKPVYFGEAPGKPQLPHGEPGKLTLLSEGGCKVEVDDAVGTLTIQHALWAGPPEGVQGYKVVLGADKIAVTLAPGVAMEVTGADTLPLAGVLQAGMVTPAPGVPLTPGSMIFKVGSAP